MHCNIITLTCFVISYGYLCIHILVVHTHFGFVLIVGQPDAATVDTCPSSSTLSHSSSTTAQDQALHALPDRLQHLPSGNPGDDISATAESRKVTAGFAHCDESASRPRSSWQPRETSADGPRKKSDEKCCVS